MERSKLVVFVCQHGALRSRIAAAYFNASAPPGWSAVSAGLDPQPEISPRLHPLMSAGPVADLLDRDPPRSIAEAGSSARLIAIDTDVPGAERWTLTNQEADDGLRDEIRSRVDALTLDIAAKSERPQVRLRDLAAYFLRLGTLGFGGPIALAAYMQRDLVERRGWVTQDEYLEGLAISQTLPGPLAAQLAMWLGYIRHGFRGAVVSAVPFILPPFLIVTAVAALYVTFRGTTLIQALFYGVGPAVIALILRGAWKLVRITVRGDRRLWAIFAAVALITFVVRSEVAVLFIGAGLLGVLLYARPSWLRATALSLAFPWGGVSLAATQATDVATLVALGVFFFKAGAFTFGSGLAIVPFLQQGVVHDFGWLNEREFLDAIAMGMITPGPVVITAVFVGYLTAGLAGGTIAAIGVFLPPFLMVVLLGPWIIRYRKRPAVQGFTKGATAAAAGAIVGAAGVIASQVLIDVPTLALFLTAFVVLWRFKFPEPLIVGASAAIGAAIFAIR